MKRLGDQCTGELKVTESTDKTLLVVRCNEDAQKTQEAKESEMVKYNEETRWELDTLLAQSRLSEESDDKVNTKEALVVKEAEDSVSGYH